ncbi:Uncharacterised protein [uncultured archaeon]|nr:Uncharacterised protein [uncultured archaeon]
MVVSPSQALELTQADCTEVNQLESRIDAYLLENFNGGGISISLPNAIKPKVKTELVRRYKEYWDDVRYECDQRDGCYLTLKQVGGRR